MRAFLLLAFCLLSLASLQASWYWPFDDEEVAKEPERERLSDLMEPASTNIDAAADFASEGKFKEAQESYRAAIEALSRIEEEHPDRAATPEFATVRNKRAYINAALDAMLLAEARQNAKPVAVTDTTELEIKLALKPWDEFQTTRVALSNDYWVIHDRLAYLETNKDAHELLNSISRKDWQRTCSDGFEGIAASKPILAARWKTFDTACGAMVTAIDKMEYFAPSTNRAASTANMRAFDLCRQDVRACLSSCQESWPKLGESLKEMNRHLESVHDVLLEAAAQRDFAKVAHHYGKMVKDVDFEEVEGDAETNGYWRTHCRMLEVMNDPKWVNAFTGAVRRVELSWGGREVDVPEKEEDDGLVKNDGDTKPEVESQIEAHMKVERKRAEELKRVATRVKSKKTVNSEIQKLMKEDPKSRKAQMLMAGEDLRNGDTTAAKEKVRRLLDEKPNDGPALNMRAAIEASEGDLKMAEKTLDQAIQSNPRDYHAYYNMANLYLQKGNAYGAGKYYETGRVYGGPTDPELEKVLKK